MTLDEILLFAALAAVVGGAIGAYAAAAAAWKGAIAAAIGAWVPFLIIVFLDVDSVPLELFAALLAVLVSAGVMGLTPLRAASVALGAFLAGGAVFSILAVMATA